MGQEMMNVGKKHGSPRPDSQPKTPFADTEVVVHPA
jgi:hypothetical protein